MNHPSEHHLLILDTASARACNLRNALVGAGAHVHVVSCPAQALMLVRRRKIHTAFIAYDSGLDTRELCGALAELNIPQIFTGSTFVTDRRALRQEPRFSEA